MRICEGIRETIGLEGPGIHLIAYYCSLEHMLLKCAIFMKQGLEVGEKCFLCLAPEHRGFLASILQRLGIDMGQAEELNQIQFISFTDMYDLYLQKGFEEMMQVKRELLARSRSEGFSGVRCVWDTKYSVLKDDFEAYLQIEKDLDEAARSLPFTCLCLFDIEQLLNEDTAQVGEILTQLHRCHGYLYTENKMIKTDSLWADA